jgi:hypothetical protein
MAGRVSSAPAGSFASRNTTVSTAATTRLMTSAVTAMYTVWLKIGTLAVDAPKCDPGTPSAGVL